MNEIGKRSVSLVGIRVNGMTFPREGAVIVAPRTALVASTKPSCIAVGRHDHLLAIIRLDPLGAL